MTGEQYQCPFCEYSAESKGSVKGHISRKTTGEHKGASGPDYTDKIQAVSVDTDPDESGAEKGTEPETPTFPSNESVEESEDNNESCCSSPSLTGSAGDVFELDDGGYVRLEAGDQICVNCDEIHE